MSTKHERVEALLARPISWPVPIEAVRSVATEEDCRLTAYLCSAGVPTCGWGETENVRLGMTWTQEYADERLRASLQEWGGAVRQMLNGTPNDNQFSAMVSLAYNIGLEGFRRSTVLRKHNEGNIIAAARAFGLWNKARDRRTGQLVELEGLTARRAREKALYLTPVSDEDFERPPQAVAAEASLARSPIAKGGAVTAATGAIATINAVSGQAKEASGAMAAVNESLTAASAAVQSVLGIPPAMLVGIALVVAGYMVVRWRREQRVQGWA